MSNSEHCAGTTIPVLSADRKIQAKKYAQINRRLSFIVTTLTAVLLLWLVIGGYSSVIVSRIGFSAIPAAGIYSFFIIVVYGVLTIPVNYLRDFILPRRYGLSSIGFGGWFAGYIQSSFLMTVFFISIVTAAYWAIGILPDLWWLVVWVSLVLTSLVLNFLLPVILTPLFCRIKPLEDEGIKQRVLRLAERTGISLKNIYQIEFEGKPTTANAVLMGVGKTKRVVLSDTMLSQYSAEEIEAVIAHELGHYKNGDFPGVFLFRSLVLFVCLWLTYVIAGLLAAPLEFGGTGDVAILPLLILIFGAVSMLLSPVSNAVIRSFETEADDFALRLTGNPQAFISAITKLTSQNLREVIPPLWVEFLLDDHPSYCRRVLYAKRYMREKQENNE